MSKLNSKIILIVQRPFVNPSPLFVPCFLGEGLCADISRMISGRAGNLNDNAVIRISRNDYGAINASFHYTFIAPEIKARF